MDKIPTKIKILLFTMIAGAGLIIASAFINVRGFANFGANIGQILGGQESNLIDSNSRESGSIKTQTAKSDIDQDGIPDDEEPLYETDPLNPDTDGDGFLDGEELAAGCSPTLPGPEDCINTIRALVPEKSLTEQFSELIAGGLFIGDLKTDSPNFSKSIAALGEEAMRRAAVLLTVDDSEIQIRQTSNDSQGDRQNYVNQMGQIVERYLIINTVSINQNAPLTEEGFINFDFAKNIEALNRLYNEISNISAPSSWLDFHKQVLKFIKMSQLYYQNLRDFQEDPLKAMLTLSNASLISGGYQTLISTALNKIREQHLELPPNSILDLLSNRK